MRTTIDANELGYESDTLHIHGFITENLLVLHLLEENVGIRVRARTAQPICIKLISVIFLRCILTFTSYL